MFAGAAQLLSVGGEGDRTAPQSPQTATLLHRNRGELPLIILLPFFLQVLHRSCRHDEEPLFAAELASNITSVIKCSRGASEDEGWPMFSVQCSLVVLLCGRA